MKNSLIALGVFSILLLLAFSAKEISYNKPIAFRDLNKNGKMDLYEDKSQSVDARVEDLLKQMTVEEKAG